MPVARFQMPDGRVARFDVPDGTTPEQATTMMQSYFSPAQASTPAQPPEAVNTGLRGDGFNKATAYTGKDQIGGFLRGAGSIGATLARPFESAQANDARRANLDPSIAAFTGADPASTGYKTMKLGAEIAGTAGAGGAIAQGVSRLAPAAVTAAPRVAQLLEAIKSGGFTLGSPAATTLAGKAADLGVRTLGGAISGGSMAGLLDPGQAKVGALVGGALPGATQAAGLGTNWLGSLIRGPQKSADAITAIKEARNAGYVIPPTQANPTLLNRTLEGFSGKLTTAQNASARNADVTNKLANRALGIADDVKLTPDILNDVRKTAGQAYENIRGAGTVTVDPTFDKAITDIATKYKTAVPSFPGLGKTNMHGQSVDEIADLVKAMQSSKQFDSSETIDAIRMLRETADKAFRSGDKTLGKANKAAAGALEDLLGRHVETLGNGPLLDSFQQARQLIAKTYSVEKAMNTTTGSVDARKLGSMLSKGKPLSGELRQAGEFANRFPKAAQAVEGMGSLPQTSPLDWAAGGTISAMTANPLALLAVAGRPAARALTMSNFVQNNLANPQTSSRMAGLLASPEAKLLLSRTAPQIATSR